MISKMGIIGSPSCDRFYSLFVSSIFCSMIHFLMFVWISVPLSLQLVHMFACFTSICNHGLTSDRIKWLDRAVVGLGVAMDFYYTNSNWFCRTLLWFSTTSYFYSKITFHTEYHIFAHLLTTVNHILIYVWLNSIKSI